jgi:hypothetical protein
VRKSHSTQRKPLKSCIFDYLLDLANFLLPPPSERHAEEGFPGMSLLMVQNELANPIAVDPLGSQAKMLSLDDIPNLIEEFRLVTGRRGGYVQGHASQSGKLLPGTQS